MQAQRGTVAWDQFPQAVFFRPVGQNCLASLGCPGHPILVFELGCLGQPLPPTPHQVSRALMAPSQWKNSRNSGSGARSTPGSPGLNVTQPNQSGSKGPRRTVAAKAPLQPRGKKGFLPVWRVTLWSLRGLTLTCCSSLGNWSEETCPQLAKGSHIEIR